MEEMTKALDMGENAAGNGSPPEISENPEVSELRAKISEMEKRHAREVNSLKCENAITLEICKSGAKNIRAVRGLITLPEPIEADQNGRVKGLAEAISALKKSDGYLFEDEKKVRLSGAFPAESSSDTPDFSRMTYSQISEYLAKNPQFSAND